MRATSFIEKIFCLLIIVLALAIMTLVSISPAQWSDINAVYQGF
jgi:hypothetical protein